MARVEAQANGTVVVKSAPASATNGQVAQALNIANQALLLAQGSFNLIEDAAVSTSDTGADVDKLNANTGTLPAGTYEVTTSFCYNCDSSRVNFIANLLIDGNPVEASAFDFARVECKDHRGNVEATGSSQALSFSRTDYLTFASDATHPVQLTYRSDEAGTKASIWSAKVAFKRQT